MPIRSIALDRLLARFLASADAKNLANNLSRAIDLIGTCQNCRVLSEDQICSICNDSSRDNTQVCVVENTSQVVQIEELGGFKGIYFVLGGYLSPIEGRGLCLQLEKDIHPIQNRFP